MADKITWADKESLVTDPTIAEINKVTDDNMNEIKSVTNINADELAEKIVYDEDDITENTGLIIEEVPEGSNIPYINSEITIGATNPNNTPTWFKMGKNLFSSKLELGTFTNEGVKSNSTTNYRNATPIQVQPNTTYTFSINGVSQKYGIYYYNNTNTFINSEGLTTGTFTTPANCYYINFRCFNADFTSDYVNLKLQIEKGDTATTYEPYVRKAININGEDEYYTNDYSTTEQVVGKYKNKPLYRKVVDYTVSSDWQSIATTENVDEYVTIQSTAKTSYVIPFYLNATSYAYFYVSSNRQNVVLASTGLTGNSFSAILEYTKTTD